MVQVLLVHPGINVNQARTNYGDTPHYVASQEGHVEVVKALLAQPNINVNQARTDLEWKGCHIARPTRPTLTSLIGLVSHESRITNHITSYQPLITYHQYQYTI